MTQDVEKAKPGTGIELESSTYDIIRNRLNSQAKDLRERLNQLNDARREVFGAIETKLLTTERITSDHNCIPRDMVAIGNRFIFGYNVHLGLKTETDLSDVFSVYEYRDNVFHRRELDLLADARFEKEFKEIYRYYRGAVFAKFSVIGPYLFMVFRVGKSVADIKTFKWLIADETLASDFKVEFEDLGFTKDFDIAGEDTRISIKAL